jgi:hypothetical protein
MASPIFDREQYELRGRLPETLTPQQKTALNNAIARVNGQIDWNAQLLGFNGTNYWGKRIATPDGSYQWKGLPETVSEKRAAQTGAFGVYDKDKDYSVRPAPFNRSEVRASADLTLSIFEEDGATYVVPRGMPRELLYEKAPRLIVGGQYIFDGLVSAEATNGASDSLYVVQDLDQSITSVRVLSNASEAISIKLEGSQAEPFLFFLEKWEDISDWTSEQVLDQFIGVWGNKGAAVSSHFLFDALDIHGFDEEQGLSLDTILESISLIELLKLVGLKPGPATSRVMSHYNFFVEGCGDLYQPTVSLDTKFVRLQTENFVTLLSETGDEICWDDGACVVLIPPAPITTDDLDAAADDRFVLSEVFDEISTDSDTADARGCYERPDAEFGECDTPNFTLTLRQSFDEDVTGIATDPGPENSVPIGANGVQFLFPPTCFIDNKEYEAPLGQFFLDGGDLDFPLVFTKSVSDGLYDRDPFSVCDGLPEDFERVIEGDDLIIDIAGEAGPVLMSDPGIENEIEIVASGGDYDGFIIGFDGLELETISFQYDAKTTYGEVRFPCVEWVFDPTLDNSTYAPVPGEAPWMGTDDGEYDRERLPSPFVTQSLASCVSATLIGGLLSFDDGIFDEIVEPNCDLRDLPVDNCEVVDGGFYQPGINPLIPPANNTVCGVECGTVDGGIYIYGEIPDSLALIDAGSLDFCVIYDNTEYDLVQPSQTSPTSCVAYNNGSYAGGSIPSQIDCIIQDKDNFAGGPYPQPPIDDGFYLTSTVIEVFNLSTESGVELQLESGDLLGLDPAIIFPATIPPSCTPCSFDGPVPIEVDCTIDNGDFESPFPVTTEANDGLYDRDLGPFCVPCQDPNAPVIPCPVDPIRVRLDQIIFSAPRWRMRPSVMNSLTPMRLWKNRTLNVSDPELSNAFVNPLIADRNSGPEDPAQYRHFARLPAEYSRNGKFWNRTEAVLTNQSYFSRALPPSSTALSVVDEKPLLYDEVYLTKASSILDSATFYVEDYLVSSIVADNETTEDGFLDAIETFEGPGRTLPYITAATIVYDAYDDRKLNSDATRVGSYFKWSRRDRVLTGFLETDLQNFTIRPVTATEPIISDSSSLFIPNIEFPDDPDEASFTNYVVSYAYFCSDMSAADEPVFDPTALFNHRNKVLCVPEIDFDELVAEDGRAILTQDFDSIAVGEREEIIETPLLTRSRYIFHDDTLPECRAPIDISKPLPPPPVQVSGRALITSPQLSLVQCGSTQFTLVSLEGITSPFVSYNWQINIGSAWVDLTNSLPYSGVETETLTVSDVSDSLNGAQFRLKVISGFNPQILIFSNALALQVDPALITITQQPQSVTVTTSPANATFSATANTNDGGTLSYQWQIDEGSGWVPVSDSFVFSGATTDTLSLLNATEVLNNSQYRLEIQSTGCSEPAFSTPVSLIFDVPTPEPEPEPEPLPVFGLTWTTTVNNLCDPEPWAISNQNQTIRYNIVDSANCGGPCGSTQAGSAIATITVGPVDTLMTLDFDGIGELQDAGFERMTFTLNGTQVASAQSRNLNLGCSSFGPVDKIFDTAPPYLLPAGTTHTLLISFTTGDPFFHVGCFYEVNLSFSTVSS